MKLTWFIDWPKKEVLFNIDDAFTDETDWFSFGFSKRGEIEGSDVCYFVRNIYDDAFNEVVVSLPIKLLRNAEAHPSKSVFDFYFPLLGRLYWSR